MNSPEVKLTPMPCLTVLPLVVTTSRLNVRIMQDDWGKE